MKKLIFLAHDPGGRDVIEPIYERFTYMDKYSTELFFTGVPESGTIQHIVVSEQHVLSYLEETISKNFDIVLITGTSMPSRTELEAIELCKNNGIKTISILDYWTNYRKRFELNNRFIFPDYLFVMDEMAKREAEKDGIPSNLLRVVGHPGLDKFINNRIKLDKQAEGICFLSQPLSVLYGQSLGYSEVNVIPDVIRAANVLEMSIRIKFHPRESDEIKNRYKDYSTKESVWEIASGYKYVVGMNSMALLHIVLVGGAKVISYEPNLKREDFCVCNRMRVTKRIGSFNELIKALSSEAAQNHYDILKDEFIWMDGRSTERCKNRIIEITGLG